MPEPVSIERVTKDYYDSEDAFCFYQAIWGGESIHIGLYDEIKLASCDGATEVERKSEWSKMSARLATAAMYSKTGQTLNKDSKVADLGSAYGGTCRYGAKTFGCQALCVEISEKENGVCRQRNKEEGLEHLVSCPKELSVFETEQPANTFDLVLSQDSLLHCGNERHHAVLEAARILKPGGFLVFTDIMQSDNADPEVLKSTGVLKRIQLETMGSPKVYTSFAEECGLKLIKWEDKSHNMLSHYTTIREILEGKREELKGQMSEKYVDDMLAGLTAWTNAASQNQLCWGYLVYQKPL
jgi:cyclopropane fatty-acyl-phospholipid synthase-like methyltransferase